MPTIEIRHVKRAGRTEGNGERERIEVAGNISSAARVGSYPAGSFQLRHLDAIVLGPQAPTGARYLVGSVRDPNITYGNTVLLQAIIGGTTGTRLASIARIGSPAGAGTVARAAFIAYGH